MRRRVEEGVDVGLILLGLGRRGGGFLRRRVEEGVDVGLILLGLGRRGRRFWRRGRRIRTEQGVDIALALGLAGRLGRRRRRATHQGVDIGLIEAGVFLLRFLGPVVVFRCLVAVGFPRHLQQLGDGVQRLRGGRRVEAEHGVHVRLADPFALELWSLKEVGVLAGIGPIMGNRRPVDLARPPDADHGVNALLNVPQGVHHLAGALAGKVLERAGGEDGGDFGVQYRAQLGIGPALAEA